MLHTFRCRVYADEIVWIQQKVQQRQAVRNAIRDWRLNRRDWRLRIIEEHSRYCGRFLVDTRAKLPGRIDHANALITSWVRNWQQAIAGGFEREAKDRRLMADYFRGEFVDTRRKAADLEERGLGLTMQNSYLKQADQTKRSFIEDLKTENADLQSQLYAWRKHAAELVQQLDECQRATVNQPGIRRVRVPHPNHIKQWGRTTTPVQTHSERRAQPPVQPDEQQISAASNRTRIAFNVDDLQNAKAKLNKTEKIAKQPTGTPFELELSEAIRNRR